MIYYRLLFFILAFKSIESSYNESSSGNHPKWNWTKLRKAPTPIVFWHGLQDWSRSGKLNHWRAMAGRKIPGLYLRSIQIGETEEDVYVLATLINLRNNHLKILHLLKEKRNSLFLNMNTQVEIVCQRIKADPRLRGGYHAVGFSQGCQLLRGVAQRCPDPPMLNFVSLGGQHQGVYGFPICPVQRWFCNAFRRFLDIGAYWDFIQHLLVPAQYWHDPFQEEEYSEKNIYLADINNERAFNATYRSNLLKLKKLYLVVFTKDRTVIPRESSLFGYYAPGQAKKLLTMQETELYKSDRIGLRTLFESGRLQFGAIDGDHIDMGDDDWSKIIEEYLMD